MFALRFLNKDKFDNYDDYKENAVPNVPDNFNFAYDVIDEIANEAPNKVAIIWTDDNNDTKKFTFRDLSRYSNMVANFLTVRRFHIKNCIPDFSGKPADLWAAKLGLG